MPAHIRRRLGDSGRRPPQGLQRPRPPAGRGRPALPQRLRPPADRRGGPPVRGLGRGALGGPTRAAGRRRGRRTALRGGPHRRPHGQGRRLARDGGPGAALPARHRSRRQPGRLPDHQRPPLHAGARPPPAPRDRARHRRSARAAGHGHRSHRLPHERRPRLPGGRRTDPGAAPAPAAHPSGGAPDGAGRHPLHDPHAGGRRQRLLRTGPGLRDARPLPGRGRHSLRALHGPGPARTRRPARAALHDLRRPAHGRQLGWRLPPARLRLTTALEGRLARPARGTGADRLGHQRRPHALLGGARAGRPAAPARGLGLVGPGRHRPPLGRHRQRSRRGALGDPLRAQDAPGRIRARAHRRQPGRGCPNAGLQPALRALQTRQPRDDRPEAADPAAQRPQTAAAAGLLGQGPSGRRAGQGDPAPGRRPGPLRTPGLLPARLRHRDRAGAGARGGRLAQQPTPLPGSLGHLGHEGRRQRRAQLFGPGRLVGRGLQPRDRLGYPFRGHLGPAKCGRSG